MCSVLYTKFDDVPQKQQPSIFRRLQDVDCRVWFFVFIVGSIAFDVTKLEYLVQYGFKINTIHIPLYLIFNAFLLYAAVTNNWIAVKIIKVYSIILLNLGAIAATVSPVWMMFEFKNGAPEHIRMLMEHGEVFKMDFWQSLEYCVLAELTMIFDCVYYATQMWLAREVLKSVEADRKVVRVEMDNIV